jgi:hypothetical protein
MLDPFKHLEVTEHTISAKFDCFIELNLDEYRESDITELPNKYIIPGIFDITVPQFEDIIHIVLPYSEISIMKTNEIEEKGNIIIINYQAGDIIVDQKYVNKELGLEYVDRILNGRLKVVKSPETILKLVHSSFSSSDLVHIEVIISQMFRDSKGNLSRHTGKYDEIWGMQKIAKNESWLSALSYQDFNGGIRKGLVSGKHARMNVLEKVINEEYDSI